MADVSKIFKPRRGKASTMAGTKASTVLANGEMFIEVPNEGSGSGHSKMKIGDGTTAYSGLPYAMGDTENDKITFSSNTSTTVATALNSVASGNSLKTLIAGLKQAVSLCNTSITKLNDDITNIDINFSNKYYSKNNIDYLLSKCVKTSENLGFVTTDWSEEKSISFAANEYKVIYLSVSPYYSAIGIVSIDTNNVVLNITRWTIETDSSGNPVVKIEARNILSSTQTVKIKALVLSKS